MYAEGDIVVYQATHKQVCKEEKNYIVSIQTGAALTKERIARLTDNTGVHISDKNRTYCELTALYWGWKNGNHKIWGLCHYRRKFSFQDWREIEVLLKKYDWITAMPYCFRCTLEEEYQRAHQKEDLALLKEILKKRKDDSYKAALEVLAKNILYPYNMLIATQEKMDTYCNWLFDILFQVEQKRAYFSNSAYQQRYMGFLAERLMTIYIWKNQLHIYKDAISYERKGYDRKRKIHSKINDKIFCIKNRWI